MGTVHSKNELLELQKNLMESTLANVDQKPISDPSRTELTGAASTDAVNSPLISIIVVNYNGADVLPKCLAALSNLDYPNCEIIIVDNGSTDGSVEFAETFSSRFPQHVLRFSRNRGLAVARNAGVRLAKGSYVAFIDNDGFAEPNWLDAALDAFAKDPRIGAIASLVLFNDRPDIINGLGGGMNDRGFGFDFLYHRPLGFYPPPEEILYPMGCGMVLRQEVAALIFPIDEMLINYYDDVEVGVRTWRSGYRVEPCPDAKVRHAFNHSSLRNPLGKEILCHRNRVRTALKYWPLSQLPGFILKEINELWHYLRQNRGSFSAIFLWNLKHIGSALAIRSRYPLTSHRSPGPFLEARELRLYPKNTDFSPNADAIGEVVDMESAHHAAALDFGWYYLEGIHGIPSRFTTDLASALLRTTQTTNTFLLRFIPYTEEPFTVELVDKAQKRVLYRWELKGEIFKVCPVLKSVDLPPGDYQVLFRCDFTKPTGCGRILGVSVNFIGLWNLS